jgi:predicted transcriptional regulator
MSIENPSSSFIPQRIKQAKQQMTVKLHQDQLAMLDSYGRLIDNSRAYIISQALERGIQKRQRICTLVAAAEKC